jgi:hypothetical protein
MSTQLERFGFDDNIFAAAEGGDVMDIGEDLARELGDGWGANSPGHLEEWSASLGSKITILTSLASTDMQLYTPAPMDRIVTGMDNGCYDAPFVDVPAQSDSSLPFNSRGTNHQQAPPLSDLEGK